MRLKRLWDEARLKGKVSEALALKAAKIKNDELLLEMERIRRENARGTCSR